MSRFDNVDVKVSKKHPARSGDITPYELERVLGYAFKDSADDSSGLEPADALDYLVNGAAIKFPLYLTTKVKWDSSEQGEFNTKLIYELIGSGHIEVERGGSVETQIGETLFIDRVSSGLTLKIKGI